jgi:hypothetical protein
MKRFLLWINLFLFGLLGAMHGQTNIIEAVIHPKPITPLVDYVLQNGSADLAKVYFLQPLHLSDQDLPVINIGWHTHADDMNHLVAISQTNHADVLIFCYDGAGQGVCWLTSPAGELRCAVKFNHPRHTAEVIPNEKVATSFEVEKNYLLYRAATAQKSAH